MENAPQQESTHSHAESAVGSFEAAGMTNSASPPALQLFASPATPIQLQPVAQLTAEALTAEELTAANAENSSRYRYEAPNPAAPDEETSYQRLINMLHAVAGDQTLYDNAAAATSVGSAFSHLVNAAQGVLYADDAPKHNGQLDAETLRDVMAQSGNGSTGIGLDTENGDFIAEHQTRSTIYPHHSNDRIGDFYVSGGFMEPHGHSNKAASQVIRTDGDWMEDAPLYNSTHITEAERAGLITNLHAIVQDDALRDTAVAEAATHSPALARMIYAAQLQLFTAENDIDGRFGPGTRTAVTNRSTYLNDQPENDGAEAEAADNAAPAVDPFIYQMAPFTELYETRHNSVQADNTIGVNFNLGAADAPARIAAVGADFANITSGAAQLTNDQINTLFYEDLQTLGMNRAQAAIANFGNLPLQARMAFTDICFSFGSGAVTGMDTTFAAINAEDYHTAGDRFRETAFFTGEGNRGPRHLDAIKFLASRHQDPRATTSAASDKNLGFDYVTENNPNEEVYAWYGGVVTFSAIQGGYGRRVIIETDIRYNYQGQDYVVYTAYAHNDQNFVQKGDFVEAGDTIAEMGGTGSGGATVYGAHVDLRIWIEVNGTRIDLSPNVLENQLSANAAANNPAPAGNDQEPDGGNPQPNGGGGGGGGGGGTMNVR